MIGTNNVKIMFLGIFTSCLKRIGYGFDDKEKLNKRNNGSNNEG